MTVPVMVGVGAVKVPGATAVLAADVCATVVYPVLLPVTVTVMVLPRSAVTGV